MHERLRGGPEWWDTIDLRTGGMPLMLFICTHYGSRVVKGTKIVFKVPSLPFAP